MNCKFPLNYTEGNEENKGMRNRLSTHFLFVTFVDFCEMRFVK